MINKLFKLSDVYLKEREITIENNEWEPLLGKIVMNRIVGIAYNNILNLGNKVPNEFMQGLEVIYKHHVKKAQQFVKNVKYIAEMFEGAEFEYALLKGSFLTTQLYEIGNRTSNDIDILLDSKDISKCQKLLIRNGFVQGSYNIKDGIVKATRKEIVMSRINYGETVPFVRIIDNEVLEVDINFSIDFKPSNENGIIQELLRNAIDVNCDGKVFKTLSHVDFLIHLCGHLYKEATTYDWVISRRDLSLYKFSDINIFFHKFGTEQFSFELVKRIKEFKMEKECYYAFYNSSIIYPNLNNIHAFNKVLAEIMPNELSFMNQIIWPIKNKLYEYDTNFKEWFECEDRIKLLR